MKKKKTWRLDSSGMKTMTNLFKSSEKKKAEKQGNVDPYVVVKFAGRKLKTEVIDDNAYPVWNEEMHMPVNFPSMCDKLRLTVYDKDTLSQSDPIGSFLIDIDTLTQTREDDFGYLPTFGPCFLNLYGSPREFSSGINELEDMDLGKCEGAAYRGRVLMSLETHFSKELEEAHKHHLGEDDIGLAQKYMQSRKHTLQAHFMTASMCGNYDASVVYELSIGNFGNVTEDLIEPSASTTHPTNTGYDGQHYYFLPWTGMKPSCTVPCYFEDVTPRIYAMNFLERLVDRFRENLALYKLRRETDSTTGRYSDEEICSDCLDFVRLIKSHMAGKKLPEVDVKLANMLDVKLAAVRRQVIKEVGEDLLDLLEKLEAARGSKELDEALVVLERSAAKLHGVTRDPQNSLPDVIIWMIVQKKREAYARIPAHTIIYSSDPEYRGKYCAAPMTIDLKKPALDEDQNDNYQIQSQLRLFLWLGLEVDESAWHELSFGQGLQQFAETYENKSLMGVSTLAQPTWSDAFKKQERKKEDFVLPAGWEWDGDWFLSPEPSVIFRKDMSTNVFTVEVYENQERSSESDWRPSEKRPFLAVASGAIYQRLEDVDLPASWKWDGTDWATNLVRACDEHGWQYSTEAPQSDDDDVTFKSQPRIDHKFRQRIRYRVRRKVDIEERSRMVGNAMMQYEKDGAWEYAKGFDSKFTAENKRTSMVRRRRFWRKVRRSDGGRDFCMNFTLSGKAERSIDAYVPPRQFIKFDEAIRFCVRIHIYEARNLAAADSSGFSDPYCRVVFLGHSGRTNKLEATLNPHWDHTFTFDPVLIYEDRHTLELAAPPVVVELFDADDIGKDEYLGRCKFKPKLIMSDQKYEPPRLEWFPIVDRLGGQGGELLACCELIQTAEGAPLPQGVRPAKPGLAWPAVPVGIRPELQRTRVEVLCWGVRNMHRYRFMAIDHPSVEFQLGDISQTTSVLRKSNKLCTFDKNLITLEGMLPKDPYYIPPLSIRVYDNRLFGSKPCVGVHTIHKLSLWTKQAEDIDQHPLARYPLFASEDPNLAALTSTDSLRGGSPSMSDWDPSMNQPDRALIVETSGDTANQLQLVTTEKTEASKAFVDLVQLDEDIDWWSKYHYSLNERSKCEKYIARGYDKLAVYDRPLEQVEKFGKFHDVCKSFRLQRKDDTQEGGAKVGEFKGNIAIFPNIKEESLNGQVPPYFQGLIPNMKSFDAIVRVYIVSASCLSPADPSGLADPYIDIRYGKSRIDNKDSYIPNSLNPVFGTMFELKVSLPRDKDLQIKVKDFDLVSRNDTIGETKIDLENRILTQHRALCGLPETYSVSGLNAWRDSKKPRELLEAFCAGAKLEKPVFQENDPKYHSASCKINNCTFVLKKFEQGLTPSHHWGPEIERLSLFILRKLDTFVPEHVETRPLYSKTQPGVEQGQLKLWIDIFPEELGPPGPPVDINPRKPKKFELRVIVWNTYDVVLDETSITGEQMSDIYVKGWINGPDEIQKTDVHYRSMDGEGNFNWRFVFPFDYFPAEKELVVQRRGKLFALDKTELRIPPSLTVQIWDNDKFSADDYLGGLRLDLCDLPMPKKSASKCTADMALPVDEQPKKERPEEEEERDGGEEKPDKLSIFSRKPEDERCNLFECKQLKGFWPCVNNAGEIAGKVEMSLEICDEYEKTLRPCANGREEPNANPTLDPPKRPETSFFWFTSPWKTCKHIVWKRFKKLVIILLVVLLLGLIIALFIYSMPGLIARKMIIG